MTCIVGLIDDGKVYIGGDSAGCTDSYVERRRDTKVFKNGDFLIGFTSSFRMGQILRYSFCPPEIFTTNVYRYMCTDFIDSLIKMLEDKKFAQVDKNEITGGEFLVGYKNQLFDVGSDFQVCELYKNYNSVGCGRAWALGSLYSTKDRNMKPKDRIILALEAAEEFSPWVRKPFTVKST